MRNNESLDIACIKYKKINYYITRRLKLLK